MRCIALGFWETTENTTENPVSFGAYILVGLGREIEIKNKWTWQLILEGGECLEEKVEQGHGAVT